MGHAFFDLDWNGRKEAKTLVKDPIDVGKIGWLEGIKCQGQMWTSLRKSLA